MRKTRKYYKRLMYSHGRCARKFHREQSIMLYVSQRGERDRRVENKSYLYSNVSIEGVSFAFGKNKKKKIACVYNNFCRKGESKMF